MKLAIQSRSAANQHVNVTRNVVELASRINHLKAFVYVSTLNAAHTGHLDGTYNVKHILIAHRN